MGFIRQGKNLWDALFSRTRQRVLGLLFGHPERSYYANEIVRAVGVGTGSVQRELARLSEAGILSTRRVGNQVHYQANPACPLYPELCAMVLKTWGMLARLRDALRRADGDVELALLFGDGVTAQDDLAAPLQILVVSPDLRREPLERELRSAGTAVGREIALTLLRPDRFRRLLQARNEALTAALTGPHLVLTGAIDPKR